LQSVTGNSLFVDASFFLVRQLGYPPNVKQVK
jgi:hypothetical protein